MNCKKVKSLIPEYIENSLKEKEKKEIERHISECEKCKDELFEIKFILQKAKDIKIPVFDTEYWKKQKEKIISGKKTGYRRKNFLKPAIAIASAFLIIFIFLVKFPPKEKVSVKIAKIPEYLLPSSNLPFSEDELLKIVDYISEKDAESLLNILLQ